MACRDTIPFSEACISHIRRASRGNTAFTCGMRKYLLMSDVSFGSAYPTVEPGTGCPFCMRAGTSRDNSGKRFCKSSRLALFRESSVLPVMSRSKSESLVSSSFAGAVVTLFVSGFAVAAASASNM